MGLPLLPRRVRAALAAGVAAAILVASVAPPPPGTGQLHGPFGFVGADRWLHALAYALLTVAVAYARRARSPAGLLAAVAVAATFGLAVEGLQYAVPWRSFDVADAATNAVGTLVAAGAWRFARVGRRLEEGPAPADARR